MFESPCFLKLRVILLLNLAWNVETYFIFGVDSANAILLRRRSIMLGICHLKFVFFAKLRRDTIQVT